MRDESWSYISGPPQRYTTNYQGYLAKGGLVKPVEDMARFAPGGKGSGDSARFWFFCLMLDQLHKENLSGDIAEVGVYQGHTAALLATIARRLGKTAFLFDTFEGFSSKDFVGVDAGREPGQFLDTSLEAVRMLVGEENTRFIKGYFPDSATQIPDGLKFCLVHIDCDLYAPIISSLEYFYERMVPGGFIVIHDYSSLGWNGAEKAVDDFFADKPEAVVPLFDSAGSAIVRRARSGKMDNWQASQVARLINHGWISAGQNGLGFILGGGWSGPEIWGVWGIGIRHEFRVQLLTSIEKDLRFEFELHAHLPEETEQEVTVSLGGNELTRWKFTSTENYGIKSVVVRRSDLASASSSALLAFELAENHPNPGGRPLGIALHRLRIDEQSSIEDGIRQNLSETGLAEPPATIFRESGKGSGLTTGEKERHRPPV